MTFRLALLAFLSAVLLSAAEPAQLLVGRDGGGSLTVGGRDFVTLAPGLFDRSWRGLSATGVTSDCDNQSMADSGASA